MVSNNLSLLNFLARDPRAISFWFELADPTLSAQLHFVKFLRRNNNDGSTRMVFKAPGCALLQFLFGMGRTIYYNFLRLLLECTPYCRSTLAH